MAFFAAITLMALCSFTAADPPSQQDYGLCSQIYVIYQYCTSQLNPSSTALSQHHASLPRRGKAGPPGPPGVVNKTEVIETIAGKFSEWGTEMEEKFATLKTFAVKEVKDMKISVKRRTRDMKRSLEENFTRWMDSAESEMNHMKAEIRSLKIFTSFESCEDGERSIFGKEGVISLIRDGNFYEVYCDMATDGGNWIVFQRRMDGSKDFYRTWEEYATGFGDMNGEFWLGLETVHQLTQNGTYELRVDLTDWNGNTKYAKYGTFSVSGRSDGYRLTVGGYSGTSGDSLTYHNGHQFTTKDKDLDGWSGNNCATRSYGAWWYGDCSSSNLNGRYNDTADDYRGIWWNTWKHSNTYLLKATDMKFRKK